MSKWLLLPPIAFFLLLAVNLLLAGLSKRLAFRNAGNPSGKLKSYGCGEDVPCPHLQPEYRQFFPFAFFFTIMHVVALIVATAPSGSWRITGIAVLYLAAALIGLFILYRR